MFFSMCFFYILNVVCFWIWYQFIYQNSNVTFFKLLHNIQKHFRIFLKKCTRNLLVFFKSIINVKKRHTQENRTFENIGASQKTNTDNEFKNFYYLFVILSVFLICIVMSSIFAAVIIHVSFIQKIIYTVFDIFFLFYILIKYDKQISTFLNEYIIFLNILLRVKKYQFDEYQLFHINTNIVKQNFQKNWFTFVIIIIGICYLVSTFNSNNLNLGYELIYIIIFLLLIVFYSYMDKDIRKNNRDRKCKKTEGITIVFLDEWKSDCLRMCQELGIKKLNIIVKNLKTKIAVSGKDKILGVSVRIGSEYLDLLSSKLDPLTYKKAVAFILGHELTHIYYKDYSYRISALKRLVLIFLILLILRAGIALIPRHISDTVLCLLFLILFPIIQFIFLILGNDRYWVQLAELRADRIGMKLSGSSPQILEEMLKKTEYNVHESSKKGFIKHIVKTYSEIDAHPSAKLRIQELKRGRSWGISEYFRYIFILKAWKK